MKSTLWGFVLSLGMGSLAFGGVSLTMDYTAFNSGPATGSSEATILQNDAWVGSTTDATRLAAARGVMDEAASMIEGFFSACSSISYSRTIEVGWDSHGGSTLATGGIRSSGGVVTGTLDWDQDSSTFFVDTTPDDVSEFTASPRDTRTVVYGSNDPLNVEDRHYANFLGTDAASHADMLSTALHEIMHAMGGLSNAFSALDVGSDGDIDLTALGRTYEVPYTGGHTTTTLPWDGPGLLGGSYYPNVIGPATVSGTRNLMSDLDVLLLAHVIGISGDDFACVSQPHGTITAVPEASGFLLFALIGLLSHIWKLRASKYLPWIALKSSPQDRVVEFDKRGFY